MYFQPLEQFEIKLLSIKSLFFCELLVSNSVVYFLLNFFLLAVLAFVMLFKIYVFPTNIQYILESLYLFILNLVIDQASKKAVNFFVFIFSLFFFILISNFLGLIPFGFTLTSHIIITFSFGFSIIVGLTIIGFLKQGIAFLQLFVPKDVSAFMVPLLVLIEVVSYISRGFSLSIRLFANIMSGHTLLNILSSFIFMLIKVNKALLLITFLVVFAICFLEVALAGLQAYVFIVLTLIYLHDSLSIASH